MMEVMDSLSSIVTYLLTKTIIISEWNQIDRKRCVLKFVMIMVNNLQIGFDL